MQTHTPYNTGTGDGPVRCILWLPRGHDAPIDLIRGLDQRKVRVRQVDDAPSAMVELAQGMGRCKRVLVIVEPESLRQCDALVVAVRRYHDRVPIWRYDPDASPSLQRFDPQPATSPLPPADAPGEPSVSDEPVGQDTSDDQPLLSQEELAMLLGEMPEDAESSER